MIGAPDDILLKPGTLDENEAAVMARSRKMSLGILRRSCASRRVLEIVENIPAWYDGSRGGFAASGLQLPLGARMIAVAEAFDAMTTDHVYRPAFSHERAMARVVRLVGQTIRPPVGRAVRRVSPRRSNHRPRRGGQPLAAIAGFDDGQCSLGV